MESGRDTIFLQWLILWEKEEYFLKHTCRFVQKWECGGKEEGNQVIGKKIIGLLG